MMKYKLCRMKNTIMDEKITAKISETEEIF